jgi:valyl-tRNA synthetase
MEKAFVPAENETSIYDAWEKSGAFQPSISPDAKPFTIILPPPNANAPLHIGHAMYVVEDIMVRYHRMIGDAVEWLPGADHAGIETQFVFEKFLAKQGKSRFDYPREELFQMIWDFVGQNRGTMETQLRRLGFSLDWSRLVFTLDPDVVAVVYKTFKKLHSDGLVYRGERLVNYCTKCGTGFSDLEVVSTDVDGFLYHIHYPLTDGSGTITVATTRPETMFGDAAIMVHPDDPRYKKLIGKTVTIPLTDLTIPIIADTAVEKEFGTGAVKVTPHHDYTDAEVGARHPELHRPFLQIIGLNGRMQNVPETFTGLRVKPAREAVIEALTQSGALEKTVPHQLVAKSCYRCGTLLEPLPMKQWFISVRPLADNVINQIKQKKVQFVPQRFEDRAIQWLTDFHDWNISRQIVWGMRIPAWKCTDCENENDEQWIVTDGTAPKECPTCHGQNLVQEADTFDTWFSSGQWPFATLQTTGKKLGLDDYERFYPTSVMETGYDILPPWVCRMMMLGLYATGVMPFQTVYLHGLVRDGKGQKMSKSKGNVVNPIEMIDKYGADALRMALMFGAGAGNDTALAEDKIRGMRNFANKLWNMCRFFLMNLETWKTAHSGEELPFYTSEYQANLLDEDKKMVKELNDLIAAVNKDMTAYRFSDVSLAVYEFAWHRVADDYIESIKERLQKGDTVSLVTYRHILMTLMKLLHPFMPFVTESIYRQIPGWDGVPLIISTWPSGK